MWHKILMIKVWKYNRTMPLCFPCSYTMCVSRGKPSQNGMNCGDELCGRAALPRPPCELTLLSFHWPPHSHLLHHPAMCWRDCQSKVIVTLSHVCASVVTFYPSPCQSGKDSSPLGTELQENIIIKDTNIVDTSVREVRLQHHNDLMLSACRFVFFKLFKKIFRLSFFLLLQKFFSLELYLIYFWK